TTYFSPMVGAFGTGHPRTLKPLVENAQRVAAPPHRGLARETVTLLVDGVPQPLEVVRQDRIHGQQAYWNCPTCAALREAVYLRNGVLQCRCCHRLQYRSRVLQKHRAALRAAKLRRKLGALPGLLSPLPVRPRHWRRDYWARSLAELAVFEAVIAAELHA